MYLLFELQDAWLKDNRSIRVEKWTAFMDQMCEESQKVDKQFEEEIAAVEKHYKDIEDKLQVGKS